MDTSFAAYADDQLGTGWNFSNYDQRRSGRISLASRSGRSISHLMGGPHEYGTKSPAMLDDFVQVLSSFAEAQVSEGAAESDDYLDKLITDNEIEQIRSANEDLFGRLLSAYVFEDAPKVRAFLGDHPSVSDFLLEVLPFLRESFGNGVILQLQIPSDEDLPVTIYAVALWDGTLDDVRVALNRFDESWWTANGHKASGRVVVDYQLV